MKPNQWPNVFPPHGGHAEVKLIADYLNEPIRAARIRFGKATEQEYERAGLPLYPVDGWRDPGHGLPPYQIIGPNGIASFWVGEFEGYPEIWERIREVAALHPGGGLLSRRGMSMWTSTGITEWPTTRAGLQRINDALNEGVFYYRQEMIDGGHSIDGSPVTLVNDPRWEKTLLPRFRGVSASPLDKVGHIEPYRILSPATHPYVAPTGARNINKEMNRLEVLGWPYGARFWWDIRDQFAADPIPEPPIPPNYDEWRRENAAWLDEAERLHGAGAMQPPPIPEPVPEPGPLPEPTTPVCPPGHYYNPTTGKCEPIGATPTPTPPVPPIVPTTGQDLILGGGRYQLSCRQFAGGEGGGSPALASRLSDLAGYFTFFSPDNIEVVIKYADLSSIGMARRFFIARMTDVAFKLTIRDLTTGEVREYRNAAGTPGEYLDFPA